MNARNLPEWSFGDRIRKVRRDFHLTQDQMAAKLGTKAATLDAWEQGRNRPKDVVTVAQAIEREFDVPAAWVLGVLHGRRAEDGSPLLRAILDDRQWEWMSEPMPERIGA